MAKAKNGTATFEASAKGYYGDQIIEPDERFTAPADFKCSWARKVAASADGADESGTEEGAGGADKVSQEKPEGKSGRKTGSTTGKTAGG